MSEEDRDIKDINRLDEALKSMEETQNNVTTTEFSEYSALFIKASQDRMTRDDIIALSRKFAQRFNLYKGITVFDHNNRKLFTVPQIFIPLKNVAPEYTNFVDKFQADANSEVPKYAAEATTGLLAAIMKSQGDVREEGFDSFNEYIRYLSAEYAKDVKTFDDLKDGVRTEALDTPRQKTTDSSKGNLDDVVGVLWK